MTKYIPKDVLLAEIERRKKEEVNYDENGGFASWADDNHYSTLDSIQDFLETLEVKEIVECKQPEYSCLETIYQCGKKPHWNIGDTLAYYEFCSDREGVCVLGKITKVDFDEEICDWIYTFEKGSVYDEQSLLEEQAYKKK